MRAIIFERPIKSGAYIFSIPSFNEAVIRESVLNAIAHRDYTIGSEIMVKQYPKMIIINNPGGFPKGVPSPKKVKSHVR